LARETIPAADFLAALPEIAIEGGVGVIARQIAAAGAMREEAAVRRIYSLANGEQLTIGVELADRILTALDRQNPDLERDYVPPSRQVCEDCGGEVEAGVMPLDLMREDPDAPAGRVWDSTKKRWVRRPKNARAGGRRFRTWNLCRLCRAEELRQRAIKDSHLHTRDRVAPKRGGRPRLLTDAELKAAYKLYVETGLSQGEIARRLHATREKGTLSGYQQSLLYGWRRLGLKLRPKGAQIAISRHGAAVDWKPHESARCKRRLKSGRRCTQWVRKGADDGLCWTHAEQERRRHE
jgi:hypothetical protein